MKKFNNVKDFNNYLEREFGFGLEEGFVDFENFVNGMEFGIIIDEFEEDMILVLNNKKYYVVENIMGIKFVEV